MSAKKPTVNPFTIAKSRKRGNPISPKSALIQAPPHKRQCQSQNANKSVPKSVVKQQPSTRNKISNVELSKIIKKIDKQYGKYCTNGKAVKIWKVSTDKRRRMKCCVCEQHPEKAHSGMSGNKTCSMALAMDNI